MDAGSAITRQLELARHRQPRLNGMLMERAGLRDVRSASAKRSPRPVGVPVFLQDRSLDALLAVVHQAHALRSRRVVAGRSAQAADGYVIGAPTQTSRDPANARHHREPSSWWSG